MAEASMKVSESVRVIAFDRSFRFLTMAVLLLLLAVSSFSEARWTESVESQIDMPDNTPRPRCLNHCGHRFWTQARFRYNWTVSDNFYSYEGYPNSNRWKVNDPHGCIGQWNGRQPSLFVKKNVWVQKRAPGMFGGLIISANAYENHTKEAVELFDKTVECRVEKHGDKSFRESKYHTFTTGMVTSTRRVGFGYYEIRAKTMPTELVNAFWFSTKNDGVSEEIDVFEASHVSLEDSKFNIDERKRVYPNAMSDIWVGKYKHRIKDIHSYAHDHYEPISNKPHTFGLYWGHDQITWFFDGQPYMSRNNTHWHRPLQVRFDVETNYGWLGVMPDPKELVNDRMQYIVMYFRAWEVKDVFLKNISSLT